MNKSKWHEANKERVNTYMREYLKEYREKNREKLRAGHRKWYANNRERMIARNRARYLEKRHWVLARKYGLTLEEYEHLFKRQKGLCAICGTDKPGGRFTILHVDHCHTTGKVRGLLCNSCNRMVGQGRDDPRIFIAAARYLTEPTGICNS